MVVFVNQGPSTVCTKKHQLKPLFSQKGVKKSHWEVKGLLLGVGLFSAVSYAQPDPTLVPTEMAPAPTQQQAPAPPDDPTESDIKTYLLNLGGYFGYNLQSQSSSIMSVLLESAQKIDQSQKNTITLLLGTIPGTSIVDTTNAANAAALNPLINTVYKSYGSGAQPSDGGLQIVKQIDQMVDGSSDTGAPTPSSPVYPADPISQLIANSLVPPPFTSCTQSMIENAPGGSASAFAQNCTRYQEAISTFVLGGIPSPALPTQLDTNTLSQLNSNSLITPLLYSTTSSQSPGGGQPASANGLTGNNQAQIAQNFIRYISVNVVPPKQLGKSAHSQLYTAATSTTIPIDKRLAAIKALGNYFVIQRGFAALMSVGESNLYEMLAKRMPQKLTSGDPNGGKPTPTSSVALNEFKMATRRLYDPTDTQQNNSWVDQINTASPATVQKEMAFLLAEIRYEMYLARQQQERLLLTNSAMLFVLGQMLQAQSQLPSAETIQQPSS